jgi:5-methylcytosine-specific restriction endonuclease McrA
MQALKVCRKCGEEKDVSCYNKKLDGLTSRCKACLKEDRAESYKANPDSRKKAASDYYKNNKERVLERLRTQYSESPEKHLNAVQNRKNRDIEAYNKRFRELQRLRYANDPSSFKEKGHNYRSKKRGSGGKLSKGIVSHLMTEQKSRCVYCANVLTVFHLDHIVPISAGGLNEDSNVQLLCPQCNLQKGAKMPEEFIALRGLSCG